MLKKLLRIVLLGFIGLSVLIFAIAVLSVVFGARPPASSSAEPAVRQPAPSRATHPEPNGRPAAAPRIVVGGTYFTFDLDYISAQSEEQLRGALRLTGPSGRVGASEIGALQLQGIRFIKGRHKVRVIAGSADGQLVQLEAPGETLWAVADAVAMPVVDHDGGTILVGESYVLAASYVGARGIDALSAAEGAIIKALPEHEDIFAPRSDAEWVRAVEAVARKTPGLVALPMGSRVGVMDVDESSAVAVKVRAEGSTRDVWTYAHYLARAAPRLPATER